MPRRMAHALAIENSKEDGGSLTPRSHIGQINEPYLYGPRLSSKQGDRLAFVSISGLARSRLTHTGERDQLAAVDVVVVEIVVSRFSVHVQATQVSLAAKVFSSRQCLTLRPKVVHAGRANLHPHLLNSLISDTERLFSRALFVRFNRIPVVTWFRSIFGDSFAFAGLVARIKVIRAFRFFAGLFFVRIFVVVIRHETLHWICRQQWRNG
jgi:hypothetical protein